MLILLLAKVERGFVMKLYSSSRDLLAEAIRPRIIACTASLHPGLRSSCSSLDRAIEVVRESGTRVLVYHIPSALAEPEDLGPFHWSFFDLLEALPDAKQFVLLANTNRANNSQEAVELARNALQSFDPFHRFTHQAQPIIKLEVLRRDLTVDDEAVLEAARQLIYEDGALVIPIISPRPESAVACEALGIPLVRVLVGRIGSMTGITAWRGLSRLKGITRLLMFFEGGLATPEHVREAFDLGACGVLMNTAFQRATHPGRLARSIRRVLDTYEYRIKHDSRISSSA